MSGSRRFAALALLVVIGWLAHGASSGGPEAPRPEPPRPRSLTFDVADLSLDNTLKLIARDTGVVVEQRLGKEPGPVTADLKRLTFWQGLDKLASLVGARIDPYGSAGRLTLVPAGPSRAPVCYDGLFRFVLRRVVASRDLETGVRAYTAHVEVAWEPHLEPLLLETQPRNVAVKDRDGRPLPVASEGSTLAPVDGKLALTIEVPLPAVPRATEQLGLFAGGLTAVAPTRMVTVDFGPLDALARAKPGSPDLRRAAAGASWTVSNVQLSATRCTVRVRIELPPGGPELESYQSWVVNNDMHLRNKAGERVPAAGYFVETSSARGAVVNYHFTNREALARPGDWRLAYRSAAGLVELPARFSFTDVPLP